jgi:hypothetical protein
MIRGGAIPWVAKKSLRAVSEAELVAPCPRGSVCRTPLGKMREQSARGASYPDSR